MVWVCPVDSNEGHARLGHHPGDQQANHEAGSDDDHASIGTIDPGLNVLGLNELIGQAKAVLNTTEQLLLSEHCTALPTERVVVALLEKIQATPEVIDACETLKGLGYTLALDDFVSTRGFEPLLDLADATGDDSSDKPDSHGPKMRLPCHRFFQEVCTMPDQYSNPSR